MVWFFLISAGLVALALSLIFLPLQAAVGVAIGVFTTWGGYGYFQSWHRGIRRHVRKHLGPLWAEARVVSHTVRRSERVNLQLALDHLRAADRQAPPIFGLDTNSLSAAVASNTWVGALRWEKLPRSSTRQLACAANALYLLRGGTSFCALVHPAVHGQLPSMGGTGGSRVKAVELEVMAVTQEGAEAGLEQVLQTMHRLSIYRGQVLSLEKAPDPDEPFFIKFHDLPAVPREAIVLPEEVLRVLERNVLGLLEHAATLRQAGQATRHGVLLHGPPGTGKTLVTKYLARAVPGHTVVLLTGRELGFIRPSCQLARLLAPSLVVMEDVDLVAEDRSRNRRTTLLHELMDEMDGLGPQSDCIFLLTTNRPEVLERALTARPGRVDQAIYFPLPDLECRRRLWALFGKDLDLGEVDLEPLLRRTEGASPAFLKELVRKAALLAAERGARGTPLRTTHADFEGALRELVEFGGELTRNLLGSPAVTLHRSG